MAKSKKEQLAAIQSVLGKEQVPDYRFTFGKYKGRTLEYVFMFDKPYLMWLWAEDVRLPVRVVEFIEEKLGKYQ